MRKIQDDVVWAALVKAHFPPFNLVLGKKMNTKSILNTKKRSQKAHPFLISYILFYAFGWISNLILIDSVIGFSSQFL